MLDLYGFVDQMVHLTGLIESHGEGRHIHEIDTINHTRIQEIINNNNSLLLHIGYHDQHTY